MLFDQMPSHLFLLLLFLLFLLVVLLLLGLLLLLLLLWRFRLRFRDVRVQLHLVADGLVPVVAPSEVLKTGLKMAAFFFVG